MERKQLGGTKLGKLNYLLKWSWMCIADADQEA